MSEEKTGILITTGDYFGQPRSTLAIANNGIFLDGKPVEQSELGAACCRGLAAALQMSTNLDGVSLISAMQLCGICKHWKRNGLDGRPDCAHPEFIGDKATDFIKDNMVRDIGNRHGTCLKWEMMWINSKSVLACPYDKKIIVDADELKSKE